MKLQKLFTVLIVFWLINYPECCIAESTSALSESARVCIAPTNASEFDLVFVVQDDGTVFMNEQAISRFPDVGNWTHIVAISSSGYHVVGLLDDGTVIASGWNDEGQCNVSDWEEVIQIEADVAATYGLCADGTVKIAGSVWEKKDQKEVKAKVSKWKDIRSIESSMDLFGIDSDGRVVTTDLWNSKAFSKVKNIQQIVAVYPDYFFLTQSGDVLKISLFDIDANPTIVNLEFLQGAVQITDKGRYIVALMPDGTVKTNSADKTSDSWEDIVAISGGAGIDSKGIIWFSNPNNADGKIISIHSN